MVDSGASESVIPAGLLKLPVIEGLQAKEGVSYTAANGDDIPNLGEQKLRMHTREGHQCNLTMQVAGVHKPLLSVTQLTSTGHDVEFFKQWGRIVHKKTGKTIHFARRNGVYVLQVWVQHDENHAAGFQRPE